LIKAMVTELDSLKKDAKEQIYKSAKNLDWDNLCPTGHLNLIFF
jgi:hypothetical protein